MNIYHLDAAILKSSEHKDKWLAGGLHGAFRKTFGLSSRLG